jgi:predicted ester cyclase
MESTQPSRTAVETVYRRFLTALNDHDLEAAARCVDLGRYREDCVGFTGGWVGWEEATTSLTTVWRGLPDLRVELVDVAVTDVTDGGSVVLAHGTATGTADGRLYGAPATHRRYTASYFDRVRLADGLIVERVQQADVLGQMRQLYGRALGSVGISAMLCRLPAT